MQYTSRLEELEKNDNFSQPFIINLAALSENCKGEPFTVSKISSPKRNPAKHWDKFLNIGIPLN